MALWRDPLEELITDLERALLREGGPENFDLAPSMVDLQFVVHALTRRTEEERTRALQDPRVRSVLTYLGRLAPRDAQGRLISETNSRRTEVRSAGPKPD